ncbi:hypothetical protein [Glaciecola petra]|uniref:MSHA biogenesis protein MshJ n=1 Tax=Glaciecola petra TaxID=3075602 RepID=A0ABU2ZUE1_9ALTE|nr:hypothetical protein [Aestuariibacter sp. P117]MDT0595658.1 hypothetical protein [Aestuariibacter sp. P117]
MSESSIAGNNSLFAKVFTAFDNLAVREQKLIFVLVPVTVIIVMILMLIEPQIKQVRAKEKQIKDLENQLVIADRSITELLNEASKDPNENIKRQIDSMTQKLNTIDESFAEQLDQLVLPKAMPTLLQQVFNKAEGLKVISVKSVAPEELFADIQSETQKDEEKIYRHGIELVFTGNYFATRDFLSEAENLGWKIYWQSLHYQVSEYPSAKTTLSLFTLSTSEAFISVN